MRFGDKAQAYDQNARIQTTISNWLSEWLEHDGEGLDAFEFGAGTGGFTRYLEVIGFGSLVATDISPRMIEVGRESYPKVDWRMANAWERQTWSVDRIYSSNLLQWCPSPEDTLSQWKSNLKPGGRMLVSVFVAGSLKEFSAVDPSFNAFPWRSSEEWISLFEQTGWLVERWGVCEYVEEYECARAALRSLHSLGAVEDRRKSFRELNRFLKACDRTVEGGVFPLSWKSLRIECAV